MRVGGWDGGRNVLQPKHETQTRFYRTHRVRLDTTQLTDQHALIQRDYL